MDIEIEPYVATQEDIDFYTKYTEKEHFKYYSGTDVDMIGDIDSMLKSLGTDVEEYLREAETGERKEKKKKKKEMTAEEKEKEGLGGFAATMAWVAYDVFKKSNGMMSL